MIGIIEGNKGSGKTTELLKLADIHNYIVVTSLDMRKSYLQSMADRLQLDVRICTFDELKYRNKDIPSHCGIAIDDFDQFMNQLFNRNLELITISNSHYSELEYNVIGE